MTAERMMNQEKLCNAINALTDDDAAYLLSRLSENRAFKPVSPRHAAGMMDYEAYKEELARIAARERTMPEITKDFLIAHSSAGKSVVEVIRDVLNAAAAAATFTNPHTA